MNDVLNGGSMPVMKNPPGRQPHHEYKEENLNDQFFAQAGDTEHEGVHDAYEHLELNRQKNEK